MEKKKAKLLFKWLANEKAILSKVYTLALLQGIMYIAIPLEYKEWLHTSWQVVFLHHLFYFVL
jgi:hypothetical protein